MAILVFSPNGTHVTKPTLEAARTSADCAGKTVVVTTALTAAQSNITAAWPADRTLEVKKGGSIANTTAFPILSAASFEAGEHLVFAGSPGTVTFPLGSVVSVAWFGADLTGVLDSTAALNLAFCSLAQSAGNGGGSVESRGILRTGDITDATITTVGNNTISWHAWGKIILTAPFRQSNWNFIGHSGTTGNQFQRGEQVEVVPYASSVAAWTVISSWSHTIKNMVMRNVTGSGIRLDGSANLGALIILDNVSVSGTPAATSIPLEIDTFFWVWIKNGSFLCQVKTSGILASILVHSSSSVTGGAAGLIDIEGTQLAGYGIREEISVASNPWGSINIRGVLLEGARNDFLTVNGGAEVTTVTMVGCDLADPVDLPPGTGLIKVEAGMIENVIVTIDTNVNIVNPHSLGTIQSLVINGINGYAYSSGTLPISRSVVNNVTSVTGSGLTGVWEGAGKQNLASVPVKSNSVVAQPAELYALYPVGAFVSYSLTAAPDGSNTAAKLDVSTLTNAGRVDAYYATIPASSLSVGDKIVVSFWSKSFNDGGGVMANPLLLVFTDQGYTFKESNTYFVGLGSQGSRVQLHSWTCTKQLFTIATVPAVPASSYLIMNCNCAPGSITAWWKPYLAIFSGASTDVGELQSWVDALGNVEPRSIPGDMTLYNHQALMLGGGVRLFSSAGLPTARIFTASTDRVANTSVVVGQPKGWICTGTGAAYSTTRANSTAYRLGVYALWSVGTTVWKVVSIIPANTTAAAAPDITGLVVGNTVVDGGVTWKLMATAAAVFTSEGLL